MEIVAQFVLADAIVVRELHDEVLVLRTVTYHGLGPLAIVGTVAGSLASFLKFFMSQDLKLYTSPDYTEYSGLTLRYCNVSIGLSALLWDTKCNYSYTDYTFMPRVSLQNYQHCHWFTAKRHTKCNYSYTDYTFMPRVSL